MTVSATTTGPLPPLLTIILVGRNDDFGGDFNGRMFAAAEFNHRNLEAAGIPHEMLLVEWNPVPQKPYLATLVQQRFPWWHQSYVVDPAWHQKLSVNPKLVFMEFFAKNVGIRRARGRFILTTNTDIWLSREVVRALAQLREAVLYRAIRVDLKREVGHVGVTHEILEDPESFLRTNVLSRAYYANGSGDFLLLDAGTYRTLRGFNEVFREAKIHKDANFCVHAVSRGLPVDVIGQVYHLDHELSWNNVAHLYMADPSRSHVGRADWNWEQDYENPDSWGLGSVPERPLDERILFIGAS